MPDPCRLLGDQGEAAAARKLEARGVRVVARNARTRYGEIDLIGRDLRGHLFGQVKTWRWRSFVSAAEAVDGRKLARPSGARARLGRMNIRSEVAWIW